MQCPLTRSQQVAAGTAPRRSLSRAASRVPARHNFGRSYLYWTPTLYQVHFSPVREVGCPRPTDEDTETKSSGWQLRATHPGLTASWHSPAPALAPGQGQSRAEQAARSEDSGGLGGGS